MRITGLATGLDMDEIVKSSMQPYRIKIDKKAQEKEILEIKQKLYREVIKDSREFYNKYFDITKSDSLLLSKNWSTTKFTSSDENILTVTSNSDAKAGSYKVTGTIAKASSVTVESFKEKTIVNGEVTESEVEIVMGGKSLNITIDERLTNKEKVDFLNQELGKSGINLSVRATDFVLNEDGKNVKGFIFESKILGGNNDFTVNEKNSTGGIDADILITNNKGVVYSLKGNSNSVTLDGITFKLNEDILGDSVITVNGKSDVTDVKDKLVKFINDYNTLVEKLNTLTMEKRDRDFVPLTADQKKEMSEDEIKLWNEKVQKGQLSKDTDLSRISNNLKQSMRTLVDGTGLNLEKIGINPVADYSGSKNGTFTIDETKLTKALEENSDHIIDMFIKGKPDDSSLSDSAKYSKTGIFQRIKDILYSETLTSTSSLLKKAGFEGTSTAYNNEITKSIEEYEQKMEDMETDFSRREQLLYTKYANLETIMNNYNSQQSYLMQQLGLS